MNIIFHTTSAIGIAVLLRGIPKTGIAAKSVIAFGIGVIIHGILDYVPHCYPINSKLDVACGLAMILMLIGLTKKPYRLITGMSCFGCVFPDLVDLAPSILNKQLGLHLPIFEKIFPWHTPQYSGSIYSGYCTISMFNHVVLILLIVGICWFKQTSLKEMVKKNAPF
jgi:hypothetical protein